MEGDIKNKPQALRAQDIIPSVKEGNSFGAAPDEKAETTVPQFDLAQEIMAEQRKTTAERRKKPGGKLPVNRGKTETSLSDTSARAKAPQIPAQDPVIAEIVARDIQNMFQSAGIWDA